MKKNIKELVPYLIILVVVVLVRTFLVTPARVDGNSMVDTLYDGEIVLLNKISLKTSKIERFDIVVLKVEKDLLVKRIIGLPGETIEYKDNVLYIDGNKYDSNYDFEETKDFKYEVPKNEYFVMGDNRDDSKDSRYFGSIKTSVIKGKVNYVLFPFSKFGKIN